MIGYFAVFDLLGFGAIIRNSSATDRSARVEAWLGLVEDAASAGKPGNYQLISDTVFMAAEDSEEGLRSLMLAAQSLLNNGVKASLPVRGSIVHGEFDWGTRLTYGQAVIDAHRLEQEQDWVGVTCAPDLPLADRLWGYDKLLVYPAPLKSGPIRLHPVVTWNVPQTQALAEKLSSGGLMNAGDSFRWELGSKLRNTSEFGAYLQLAKDRALPADRFRPFFPFRVIEEAVLRKAP